MHRRMGVLLIALAFSACSGMKVSTTAMPGAAQRLEGARTYAWLPESEEGRARRSPLVQQFVMQAVDRELALKGYRRVDFSADPGFVVGWHTTSREVTEIDPGYYYGPYGYPYGPYGGAWGPPSAHSYVEGTLVLDVVDPSRDRIYWRGDAQANLGDNPSSKDAQEKINEAAKKLLAEFPPEPGEENVSASG